MNAAVEELKVVIGKRTVTDVARDSGIPRWVLYDWLNGTTKCPRGEHLVPIAKGMKRSVEKIVELCDQPNGDIPPAT